MIEINVKFGPEEIDKIFKTYVKNNYPGLNPESVMVTIAEYDRRGGMYVSSVTVKCSRENNE